MTIFTLSKGSVDDEVVEIPSGLLFCLVVAKQQHFVINQKAILDNFYLHFESGTNHDCMKKAR